MMYGLCGASRSGKTTLAKALAQRTGMTYVDASTTALMKEGGFNPVAVLSIEDRITAQEYLLDAYLKMMSKAPKTAITDRTPIDMFAYTAAEVSMHACDEKLGARIDTYLQRCLLETDRLFSISMLVHPLSTYEVDPTKPPPNLAYQRHIHTLILGAQYQIDCAVMSIPNDTVVNRVEHVMEGLGSFTQRLQEENQGIVVH